MSDRPAPPRITGFDYVRPLGRGGFAEVYLYDQDMPRRRVAVKVLSAELDSARDRSAFETEVDAMARLSAHPSIVSVFQAGLALDGRPYLVMEFCPDSMKARTRGAPAHLQTVLDAGVHLAGALETAHRARVLHRDVKPSNVLISATGRPALTDFGISSGHGRDAHEGTARAMSIPWAAPELLSGETTGTVATEVWSLGATLYSFASGHSPFEAEDPSLNTSAKMRARIAKARYRPVPGAVGYEPFDAVLAKAMSPRPEDRFASMREFGEELQRLQRHYGYAVTPLEVVGTEPAPGETDIDGGAERIAASRPRTPAPRRTERARARAALAADRDGVLPDRPPSPMRAGLIGAAAATLGIAVLAGVAKALGWF